MINKKQKILDFSNFGIFQFRKVAKERKKEKAFTLVELLVVVAIIGLLATVVLFAVEGIRSKSRDSRRVSDIKSIQEGLTLYQNNHQTYPVYNGYITGGDTMSTALVSEGLIQSVPTDPLNSSIEGVTYKYHYYSDQGKTYLLKYYLETGSIHGKSQGLNQAGP